jgi:hypothetical protein
MVENPVAGTWAFGDHQQGFQSVPVHWTINTPRRQGFFRLSREVTGR